MDDLAYFQRHLRSLRRGYRMGIALRWTVILVSVCMGLWALWSIYRGIFIEPWAWFTAAVQVVCIIANMYTYRRNEGSIDSAMGQIARTEQYIRDAEEIKRQEADR